MSNLNLYFMNILFKGKQFLDSQRSEECIDFI